MVKRSMVKSTLRRVSTASVKAVVSSLRSIKSLVAVNVCSMGRKTLAQRLFPKREKADYYIPPFDKLEQLPPYTEDSGRYEFLHPPLSRPVLEQESGKLIEKDPNQLKLFPNV